MIASIIAGFCARFFGTVFFVVAFRWTMLARLYSLEVDVAELQDRHIRNIRKAAADKRWQGEEELDANLLAAATQATSPKKKGWTKWASKSENSLGESQAEP